jgi:ABC-type bacteriocin/lantibiotic exporter with double-glycine peptidase domain
MPKGFVCAALLWPLLCSMALATGTASLWLDVPFVKQRRNGCGAAVIAMVMQYWQQHQGSAANINSAYDHIQRELYSPGAHGIYASAMERYFEQHSYRAIAFVGQLPDLEREIAKGRPLITALKPDGGKELHYVVVVGVDQPDKLVMVNDPAQRKLLKEGQSSFEREWKATNYWTLLAVPRTHPD